MKVFAITIDLKDDSEIFKEYDAYHKAVWPEVKAAVAAIGIRNVKIFRLGNRLVQVFEAEDAFVPKTDMPKYSQGNPTVEKWDAMMQEFQVPLSSRQPGEWWAEMKMVYDSNW